MSIEKLRDYRKQKKISAKAVAQNIGVSIYTISRWETRYSEIPLNMAVKYAQFIGLELKFIIQ